MKRIVNTLLNNTLKELQTIAFRGRRKKGVLREIPVVFALSIFLAGCSRQPSAQPAAGSAKDSTTLAQSSTQTAGGTDVSLTYEQRQGKYVYMKYCAVCHGEQGKGDGFNAFNLDPKPRDFTDSTYMSSLTDERIEQTISGGGRSVNKSSSMPSWGGRLQKEDLRYVVAYVRLFSSSK